MSSNGQFLQTDFADLTGGLNLTDTVFKIGPNQAADGCNFDYVKTGGIRKRPGAGRINASPNSQTYTRTFGVLAPVSGLVKSVLRAAGTQLQLVDTTAGTFTPLTRDNTGASNAPFSAASPTQDVQFVQFSNGTSDILWGAGGGTPRPIGAYSTSKYTLNGARAPTVALGTLRQTSGGQWSTGLVGQFYWAYSYVKASTGAESNAAGDATATTLTTSDSVYLTLTPPPDTIEYSKINIYRSTLDGTNVNVSGFTTGSLIATIPSTQALFIDRGDLGNPDITSATTIPRPANLIIDNSPLPYGGPYNTLAIWGNRLVTSNGNQLYISDVNKSESWPLSNYITVPSAGPITALGTISYTSAQANSLFEVLVIFKERELWVINPGSANDYTTWALLKIDSSVGCPNQSLVVPAQGFLSWIDYRGIWLWDGSSKPIYCSRPIEPLFAQGGDIDKSNFAEGCGAFFRRQNQIIWYLSSRTYGAQMYAIKMDVRLTLLRIEQELSGRTIDAVLIPDVNANPVYAALSYVPLNGQDEQLIQGDASGYAYFGGYGASDGTLPYLFRYKTAPLSCGNPNIEKTFHKVIVWVENIGTWDLNLDYWSNYKTSSGAMATMNLPLTTAQTSVSLWDVAQWDTSTWDSYAPEVVPLIFNLMPGATNSNQGKAIQLQFRNDNANQPITIHGFSLVYSEGGGVTA